MFERARLASEILVCLKQLIQVYNLFGQDLGSKIAPFHIALRQESSRPSEQVLRNLPPNRFQRYTEGGSSSSGDIIISGIGSSSESGSLTDPAQGDPSQ